MYPEIPEYETESESDTTLEEESYDKKSCEIATRNSHSFSAILLLLLCGMVFIYFYCFSSGKTDAGDFPDGKTEVSVSDLIKHMKNHFKNQHGLTYPILNSQLKKVVGNTVEPSAPAIITLVANEGAELTASEFSQQVVRKLAPETHLLINDTKYWDDEPDNIKFKIDEEIRTFAKDDHLSIIIVDKVEKIPAEAAMIFHSYCDHEAAPYKRAIFFFIVPAIENIPVEASVKYIDRIAMDSLRNVWRSATNDLIDSLITRLTVSVVSVR